MAIIHVNTSITFRLALNIMSFLHPYNTYNMNFNAIIFIDVIHQHVVLNCRRKRLNGGVKTYMK